MKPTSEASGVRNSWLALAMKSTRSRSTRRASVWSRKVMQRRHDFAARRRERRDADVEQPFDRHALAPLHGLGFAARHHPAARVDDVGRA